MKKKKPTWVFGYGSLIWRQDFPFIDSQSAYIRGWERRFWQGSHDHRGLPERPGRVVTLIESPAARCNGKAFLVDPDVFTHLDHREKNGYERISQEIVFGHGSETGVVYIAPVGNHAFLGAAPLDEIAAQISRSKGPSGCNREYLLNLAVSLRELDAHDPHVFELERLLR